MGLFITAIVLVALGVVAVVLAAADKRNDAKIMEGYRVKLAAYQEERKENRYASEPREPDVSKSFRVVMYSIAGATAVLAVGFFLGSTVYSQSVGEAKVFVDAGGKQVGEDLDPGWGAKAPWVSSVDFDLFSQELVYAGGDTAPSYTGGTVNGREVTVSVGGINGGSTEAQVDMSVVYSLDADEVVGIFKDWRSQERFTKSIVEKTVLAVTREVPANYTAIEFRGGKRGEAADRIASTVLERLKAQGVEDVLVNIQDIRFSDTVQAALNEVENANQAVQKAEADQRKVEVEAETARIKAQGVADANEILQVSLTPELLQQKYIDALGEGTIYVVPDGSTPFIGTK